MVRRSQVAGKMEKSGSRGQKVGGLAKISEAPLRLVAYIQ